MTFTFATEAPDRTWADDPANVAMLIRYLGCKGHTVNWDDDDYAYCCEKAHKWQADWEALQAELAAAIESDAA